MEAFILPVGDELLIGQVTDTNSCWIAAQLNQIGVSVRHTLSVGDVHDEIIKAIGFGLSQCDIVFMTGGLGPTKDDITKKAIADFLGVDLFFHEETWSKIQQIFEKLGKPAGEMHRMQCYMPMGVSILSNNVGTAPGMWFEVGKKVIVSMPGVPSEMKYIMENEVIPLIVQKFPGEPIAHRTILTAGAGETDLAALLQEIETNLPTNLKLAYLPAYGQVRLRLTGRGTNQSQLDKLMDEKAAEIENAVSRFVFGTGEQRLESAIGDILRKNKKSIATAESCTGGLISHKLTSIAGASDYFVGSIIAYAYEAKIKHLNVRPETLENYGVVSEQCVREMVAGILETMEADYGVAISGIAGPGGGTIDKPVGTIWIAVGSRGQTLTRKINFNRGRAINVEYASNAALSMVWDLLRRENLH